MTDQNTKGATSATATGQTSVLSANDPKAFPVADFPLIKATIEGINPRGLRVTYEVAGRTIGEFRSNANDLRKMIDELSPIPVPALPALPATGSSGESEKATAKEYPAEAICKKHDAKMRLRFDDRYNRHFYSHKTASGWCNVKADEI